MPHAVRATGREIGPAAGFRKCCIAGAAMLAMQGFAAGTAAHEGYADLVEELKPSVVSIYVAKDMPVNMPMQEFQFPENSPFNELFREFFNWQQRSEPQRRRSMALGSGFITDEGGYIVTNHHVIEGAAKISVRLHDEREFTAELIGADPKTDIALLRIDAGEALPAVTFGDSERVRVGDPVLVIGNPHGFGFSVSAGIISAGTGRSTAPMTTSSRRMPPSMSEIPAGHCSIATVRSSASTPPSSGGPAPQPRVRWGSGSPCHRRS